jgi:glucokinase
MSNDTDKTERIYLGVDIGGTKVQASLAEESGRILVRKRCRTPRDADPQSIIETVNTTLRKTLKDGRVSTEQLTAIGVAVPGVVDPDKGLVIVTPNTNQGGVSLGTQLQKEFCVQEDVGNDTNFGTLGEAWLGAARDAESAMGILVGTGIGGGLVHKGVLWRGAREAAAEIGHIVMQIGGPKCGCGNHGCFEALAGRRAIERDIRQAVAEGRETVLTELLEGDLSIIRSGMLRRALEAEDRVVSEIIDRAAEVIGYACLTVRHLVDPSVIVLGGGVMEACGRFIMPTVRGIVESDKLPGARKGGKVVLSALEDDAVVLGAVAAARALVGRGPFGKAAKGDPNTAGAKLAWESEGQITVDGKLYDRDIHITAKGKVKNRDKFVKKAGGSLLSVSLDELKRVCKGNPQVLFVGTGESEKVELQAEAVAYLDHRDIRHEVLSTPQVIDAYNASTKRKVAVIHVS